MGAVQTSNGAKGPISAGPNPTQITMFDATQTYPLDNVSGLNPVCRTSPPDGNRSAGSRFGLRPAR